MTVGVTGERVQAWAVRSPAGPLCPGSGETPKPSALRVVRGAPRPVQRSTGCEIQSYTQDFPGVVGLGRSGPVHLLCRLFAACIQLRRNVVVGQVLQNGDPAHAWSTRAVAGAVMKSRLLRRPNRCPCCSRTAFRYRCTLGCRRGKNSFPRHRRKVAQGLTSECACRWSQRCLERV